MGAGRGFDGERIEAEGVALQEVVQGNHGVG